MKKPMRFGRVFLSAAHALGIEAASFASLQRDAVTGAGAGCGDGSKDIAESPTASPERTEKSQQTTDNSQQSLSTIPDYLSLPSFEVDR